MCTYESQPKTKRSNATPLVCKIKTKKKRLEHTRNKSRRLKARSNENGPEEKKTRLENVDQNPLSFPETCKRCVKLNMNFLKNSAKTAFHNVVNWNKQGMFLCFCIVKEKQLKVSIPKERYCI